LFAHVLDLRNKMS